MLLLTLKNEVLLLTLEMLNFKKRNFKENAFFIPMLIMAS